MIGARLELINSSVRFILWSSREKCSLACGYQCFKEICDLHLQCRSGIALPSEILAFTYQITGCYYAEDHHMNIHRHGNFRPTRLVIFLEMIARFLHPQYETIPGVNFNMDSCT